MNVEDKIIRTLTTMYESNSIDRDKYNAYVHAINCWIEQIKRLEKENKEQKNQISELEFELSVKENLLKIKNGLFENEDTVEFLLPPEPISVAEQLINATYTREKGDMEKAIHKAFGNNFDTVIENVYSVPELRQIAEHLLVYCNHNSEDNEK